MIHNDNDNPHSTTSMRKEEALARLAAAQSVPAVPEALSVRAV